jgi:four helix bundle protein
MIYENLEVWKKSKCLAVSVYKSMARCRDYGFKDQITRCSLSVVSNIAEGMERKTTPDKVRFLVIAKGSIAEFKAQTQVGMEIDYIEHNLGCRWSAESEEVSKMLQGLINSLT